MKRKTVAIRAAAGVMAAVLVTMAAAGIWGSRFDSKNHKEEPAEKTEGQPNQSAASEDSQGLNDERQPEEQTTGQSQTAEQSQGAGQSQTASQGQASGRSQTASQRQAPGQSQTSGQEKTTDKEQTSDQGQADAQNQAAGQGTQSGQSQTGSQQNQNSSETVSEQYQVGDIMEDGAMYTGGDVEAGLALAELVAGMKKPTVSLVLGGGHSIGVPLAVAAKHSFIVPSATMTIHPVRMSGLMLGVPQTMDYFQRMQERITRFVTANSHISAERFYELAMNTQELVMDVGTVLDGADAVEEGLIDSLGTLSDALACLYRMIDGTGGKKGKKKKASSSEKA